MEDPIDRKAAAERSGRSLAVVFALIGAILFIGGAIIVARSIMHAT
jgi:hypothetical protein